jgi:hypothetical protein
MLAAWTGSFSITVSIVDLVRNSTKGCFNSVMFGKEWRNIKTDSYMLCYQSESGDLICALISSFEQLGTSSSWTQDGGCTRALGAKSGMDGLTAPDSSMVPSCKAGVKPAFCK